MKRYSELAHGLEELILLKCSYYSKQSTDSYQSEIPIKIPIGISQKFFTDVFHRNRKKKKKLLKFRWNNKRTQNSQSNLEKKTNLEASYFLILTIQNWHKNRHRDQWKQKSSVFQWKLAMQRVPCWGCWAEGLGCCLLRSSPPKFTWKDRWKTAN